MNTTFSDALRLNIKAQEARTRAAWWAAIASASVKAGVDARPALDLMARDLDRAERWFKTSGEWIER